MASVIKSQAEVMLEIAYAAFSMHFRTVNANKLTDENAHAEAQKHWNDNLPGVQQLWAGIAQHIVTNVAAAQLKQMLPRIIIAEMQSPNLPDLGGGPVAAASDAMPAALARRLAATLRIAEQSRGALTGRHSAADPNLSQPPSTVEIQEKIEAERRERSRKATEGAPWNTHPGLAVGRDTESE